MISHLAVANTTKPSSMFYLYVASCCWSGYFTECAVRCFLFLLLLLLVQILSLCSGCWCFCFFRHFPPASSLWLNQDFREIRKKKSPSDIPLRAPWLMNSSASPLYSQFGITLQFVCFTVSNAHGKCKQITQ